MTRFASTLVAALGCFFLSSVGAAPPAAAPAPVTVDTSTIGIGDIVNALGIGFVSQINAFLTLDTLTNNLISVNFDVKNPLALEITIDSITSSAGLNGTVFAQFTHDFPNGFVIGPLATANSGTFGNVLLTQGATASLEIIPFGILDLSNTNVKLRALTIKGKLGIPIPLNGLKQSAVPTTYTLDLGS